jgi:hypothetical protein
MLGRRSSNAWRLDTACCVIDFSPFHDSVTPQRIHGGHRATSPAESFRLQVFDHSPFGQGKCSDIPNTRLLWHHETGSRPDSPSSCCSGTKMTIGASAAIVRGGSPAPVGRGSSVHHWDHRPGRPASSDTGRSGGCERPAPSGRARGLRREQSTVRSPVRGSRTSQPGWPACRHRHRDLVRYRRARTCQLFELRGSRGAPLSYFFPAYGHGV